MIGLLHLLVILSLVAISNVIFILRQLYLCGVCWVLYNPELLDTAGPQWPWRTAVVHWNAVCCSTEMNRRFMRSAQWST